MFLWLPSILRSKESWPLDKEKYSNFNYPMFPGYFDSQNIWDIIEKHLLEKDENLLDLPLP